MSPSIENQLREALVEASEDIQPRADLADRVRRATRHRRRVLTSAVAAGLGVVMAGCLIAFYGHGTAQQRPATHRHIRKPPAWQTVTSYGTPVTMAVSGRWLYVAVDDPGDSSLIAYDLRSGRLIRRVSVPASPSAVRIGPGGLVWLAFYPDNTGGGTGVWLLSPDLKLRSGVNLGTRRYLPATPFDVLPTGADTAMLTAGEGLATLRLPPPGQPGKAEWRWGAQVPRARQIQGVPVQLAAFAGRVAVRVASDDGHGLITFAGEHSPEFGPKPADGLGAMTVSGSGLWVTVHARNGGVDLGLTLLNDQLRPVTPSSIRANRLLADANDVEALGNTVWVILGRSPGLACFTDSGGRIGPVATLGVFPAADAGYRLLASVGRTLYVLKSTGIGSYRVPTACR